MYKSLLILLALTLTSIGYTQIPETYDLRNVNGQNFVTTVKSQQGGTCWTHGTMASMEGNLLMSGNWTANGETGEPALAEYHLDWWNGYNSYYNADLDPPFNNGEGLEVHNGGDYRVATAYMSRLDGAVRDQDGQSYDFPPVFHNDDFHIYFPMDVEWYTAGPNLENIDLIKQKVMEHGVMATCMCYSGAFMSYFNHYQPPTSTLEPNHSVSIIGWDDNHITQAPEPGAWLVKNSWGTGWGQDGYFWISYYDKHACQNPDMGAISFINVDQIHWDTSYYHDYHGWRDTLTIANEAFNAFVASEDEDIVAINIFTADNDVTYTVSIYGDFNGSELLDLRSTESGNFAYSGMHTILLSDTARFLKNEPFYIYYSVDKGGIPYDRTSEVPVLLGAKTRTIVPSIANPEESYYYDQGTWKDFYDYDDPSGFQNTGNFCIKALAIHNPVMNINSIDESDIINIYPTPFNSDITINWSNNDITIREICVYSVTGKLVSEEVINSNFNGINLNLSELNTGVYILVAKSHNESVFTKKIVKR